MARTRSELRSIVEANIGRTDKTTQINLGLDLGLEELCRYHEFRDLITSVDLDLIDTSLSISDATWSEATLTLTKASGFSSYSFEEGDEVTVSGGTGVTAGDYVIASATSDSLVLEESIGSGADGQSDISLSQIFNPRFFELPSDCLHLKELRFIDGTSSYPIDIRDKKWVVDRWPYVESLSKNKPVVGYVEDNKFWCYPVNGDSSYVVRATYVKRVSAFSGDSVENPVPALDYALSCWATGFVFDSIEEFAKAASWYGRAASSLLKAIKEDKRTKIIRQMDPFTTEKTYESPTPWLDPFVKRSS